MFIILLTYKKSLELVDKYLSEHSAFLDECYKKNYFLVSGRKNPRTGGVIISQLENQNQLEEILKRDPFKIHEIADYQIIEFIPTKYHTDFSVFLTKNISE